jgi:hypothetical protein
MNNPSTAPVQHEEVSAKARALWQSAGSPEGRDLEFWLAAEAELQRERADVAETRQGLSDKPARSTPDGAEISLSRHSSGTSRKRVSERAR